MAPEVATGAPRAASPLRCPTCGAEQEPAAVCRRCRCDLGLLIQILDEAGQLTDCCRQALRRADYVAARDWARRRWELDPDEEAARYLAVCNLLLGEFQTAVEVCNRCPPQR